MAIEEVKFPDLQAGDFWHTYTNACLAAADAFACVRQSNGAYTVFSYNDPSTDKPLKLTPTVNACFSKKTEKVQGGVKLATYVSKKLFEENAVAVLCVKEPYTASYEVEVIQPLMPVVTIKASL